MWLCYNLCPYFPFNGHAVFSHLLLYQRSYSDHLTPVAYSMCGCVSREQNPRRACVSHLYVGFFFNCQGVLRRGCHIFFIIIYFSISIQTNRTHEVVILGSVKHSDSQDTVGHAWHLSAGQKAELRQEGQGPSRAQELLPLTLLRGPDSNGHMVPTLAEKPRPHRR